MKIISSVYKYLSSKEKKQFNLLSIYISIYLILELCSLSLFIPIIQLFFSNSQNEFLNQIHFLNNYDFQTQLLFLLSALITIYLIKNSINAYLIFYKKRLLADMQINFSSRVFNYYLNQNYSFFLKTDKPEIIRNIGLLPGFIEILENFINVVIEVFIIIIVFSIILYTDYKIGVVLALTSVVFSYLIIRLFGKKMKRYGEEINIYQKRYVESQLDSFGIIKEIILSKKQNFFLKDFKNTIFKRSRAIIKHGFLLEIPRQMIEVLIIIGISILILALLKFDYQRDEMIVTLSITAALIFRAIPSVTRIIYQTNNLSFKIDMIKRVQNLLSNFHYGDIQTNIDNFEFEKLELKDLSYEYKDNSLIFKNFNLKLDKNKTIGLIGKSGSGKSTLLDLMSCLIEPKKGEIFINNQLLDNKLKNNYQNIISYISQKNYLLNGTIEDNIAFAVDKNDIDLKKIENAIKLSNLESLINSYNEGIKYQIGEDGKNLSGGQRQRLIIARAIYKETQLIFFDESTSALDEATEKKIFEDIHSKLHHKKTLVISSHNKNLLSFCDQIINVENLK